MTVLWLYDCMTVWCTVYGVWQVAADSRTIRFEGTLGYLLPLPPPFPAPTCALRALNATRMYVHLSRAWSLCPLRAGPSCLTCDDDGGGDDDDDDLTLVPALSGMALYGIALSVGTKGCAGSPASHVFGARSCKYRMVHILVFEYIKTTPC